MTTSQLAERQRSAIRRIAALVLVNAMMFQEVLAQKDERIRPLQDFRHESDPVSAFADHWKSILDEINYYPIFNVALHLIRCISLTLPVGASPVPSQYQPPIPRREIAQLPVPREQRLSCNTQPDRLPTVVSAIVEVA